jgi:hypothetical protein
MVKALSLLLLIIYAANCFTVIDVNDPIANLDAVLSNIR